MGAPGPHVAKIARRRHPQHALPEEANGYFAEMGRLAVELGNSARRCCCHATGEAARIREEDDAMDDLHRHLFTVLMDRDQARQCGAARRRDTARAGSMNGSPTMPSRWSPGDLPGHRTLPEEEHLAHPRFSRGDPRRSVQRWLRELRVDLAASAEQMGVGLSQNVREM